MVNLEAAKKAAPSLLVAGRQWLLDSINDFASSTGRSEADRASSEEPSTLNKKSGQQPQIASTEYLVYNWLESLFARFQVVVLWHEPIMSLFVTSGLLISFLFTTYFAPRFYATIMIALFIYNLNKFWFKHVWPDIRVPPSAEREAEMKMDVDRFTYLHPQLMTLAELGNHLGNSIKSSEFYLHRLFQLRQQRPVAFCLLVCSILSCTAYIGNRVSGFSLMFSMLALVSTVPGIYCHLIGESTKNCLKTNLAKLSRRLQSHCQCLSGSKDGIESREGLKEEAMDKEQGEVSIGSVASGAKTHALNPISLFERFKQRNLNISNMTTGPQSAELPGEGGATLGSHGDRDNRSLGTTIATPVSSPTIDVPRNRDQDKKHQTNVDAQQRQRRHFVSDAYDDDLIANSGSPLGERGDFSSNSSVSLVGSDDDDQQDGFVLL